MKILIASRSEGSLTALRALAGNAGPHNVGSVLMTNGAAKSLAGPGRPDVIVLHAGEHVVADLRVLAEQPARDRAALVVVGDGLPTEAMKYAMRAGARDFIGEHDAEELRESLRRLAAELDERSSGGRCIAVINAKGGSGATFVATSLACLSAAAGEDTAVVDLDFQYAALPSYLDVAPGRGLLEALALAPELDDTAIEAYAARHGCGLRVFAPQPDSERNVDFDAATNMSALLGVLKQRYRRLVFDVPRHLDDTACSALAGSDRVLVVLQQSLAAVHDAVRLKTILTRELGLAESRITSVVNRFTRSGALEMNDICSALGEQRPARIPNQYKLVSRAVDLGAPVVEQAPGSPVAKALAALYESVFEVEANRPRGLLGRAMSRMKG